VVRAPQTACKGVVLAAHWKLSAEVEGLFREVDGTTSGAEGE
jgi:hypothetical protein